MSFAGDTIQRNRCRKFKGFYPSFTPIINSLSVITSFVGVYSFVQIKGSNFLPPSNGITYVDFGSYKQLPITFYSSFNIAFMVPLNATAGNYNVQVVNVYNNNFSPQVDQSYPGIKNYSNSIIYTLT
jgi:uncharacterized protein (TIGR03437 family)